MQLLFPSLKLANLEWPHFTRASWPTWQGKHLNGGMALKLGTIPSLCICKRLTHYFTLHLTTKFKYTILLQTCKLFGPPWVNAHFVSCESHFISCDVRPSTCLLCERMMELHDTTISSIFIDSLLPEAPPTGDIGTTTKLTIFVLDFIWWHACSQSATVRLTMANFW